MTATVLHFGHYVSILSPPESHKFFGAGFLFLGIILLVEVLSGNVWHRSKLRTAIFPVMAIGIGEGLIIVSFLDPVDRIIHFSVGAIVVIAGWQELRFRTGKISRTAADVFVIPALLAAGFEMGVIHGKGDTFTMVGHMVMGLTAAAMAVSRVIEAKDPTSLLRRSGMGACVVFLGVVLLVAQP